MTKGSCLCGGVAFEAGDSIELRNCHCSRCRKVRGAAFATNLFVPAAAFHWLRGEDLEALIAEGHRPFGGPVGESQGEQREADRAGIGEHVPGVGQQRQRVRDDASRHLHGHEAEEQRERERQPAAVGVGASLMGVSRVSVDHRPTIRRIRAAFLPGP